MRISTMDQTPTLIRILILGHLLPAGMCDLKVFQSPPSLVVTRGQRAGDVSLSEGDVSLVISNVTWEDAGIYFCKVHMWDQAEEQGPGTSLAVYAHPSQPEIFLNVATRSHDDIVLTCRTSGYYPPGIAISWHSNEVDFADPGPLEIWKSEHGDFQASRHLVLPATYGANLLTVSCIVQHISLPAPLYANYSHNVSEFGVTAYQLVQYLNILKIALVLGLTISILLTVQKRCRKKGEE